MLPFPAGNGWRAEFSTMHIPSEVFRVELDVSSQPGLLIKCSYLLAKDHADTARHCFDANQIQFAVFSSSHTSAVTRRLYIFLNSQLVDYLHVERSPFLHVFVLKGMTKLSGCGEKACEHNKYQKRSSLSFLKLVIFMGLIHVSAVMCNAAFLLNRKKTLLNQSSRCAEFPCTLCYQLRAYHGYSIICTRKQSLRCASGSVNN